MSEPTSNLNLTVILDLDEFLIHTYFASVLSHVTLVRSPLVNSKTPKKRVITAHGATVFYTEEEQNQEWTAKFVKRPWLEEFFKELAEIEGIEIIFWTASARKVRI